MKEFTTHTGKVATLNRHNVDTDQIIPKQFLKRIERTGFGEFLFYDWRFHEDGETHNPEFELNQPHVKEASILVTSRNFGSGSSREHAVWALDDYGFRCVIAPSFADIFHNNCFKNGLLPVVLPEEVIEDFLSRGDSEFELTVCLHECVVIDGDNRHSFEVHEARRDAMLQGLDDIAQTLKQEDKITAFEQQRGYAKA